MRRDGGFVWIQSYATLVNNPRNMPKPQHIVSICFVLAVNPQDQSAVFCQPNTQATTTNQHQIIRRHSSSSYAESCIQLAAGGNHLNSSSSPEINNDSKTLLASGKESGSSGYESASSQLGGSRTVIKSCPAKSNYNYNNNVSSQPKRKEKSSTGRKYRKMKGNSDAATTAALTSTGGTRKIRTGGQLINKQISHSSQETTRSNNKMCSHNNSSQLCSCLPINDQEASTPPTQTIGSLRRPSDDTCSVVSSVASTSISSNSSCVSHQVADFLGISSSNNSSTTLDSHQQGSYHPLISQDHASNNNLLSSPISISSINHIPQNEDLRQYGGTTIMMQMDSGPTPMAYELGLDSYQRQASEIDTRQSLQNEPTNDVIYGNQHHPVWPSTATVVDDATVLGPKREPEVQHHHQHHHHPSGPEVLQQVSPGETTFTQLNEINVSPQSLYLSSDWFIQDGNYYSDYGRIQPIGIQMNSMQSNSTNYYNYPGADDRLNMTNYGDTPKNYYESSFYPIGNHNLSPMNHHQQATVIINENNRCTVFGDGSRTCE